MQRRAAAAVRAAVAATRGLADAARPSERHKKRGAVQAQTLFTRVAAVRRAHLPPFPALCPGLGANPTRAGGVGHDDGQPPPPPLYPPPIEPAH